MPLGQCRQRTFDYDSFVCVCDATGCDELGMIDVSANSRVYSVWTSTRDADRLVRSEGNVQFTSEADKLIR